MRWWARAGGVAGPAAFVTGWVAGGIRARHDLSPVDDAISRLAAYGAPTRPLMTAGFVGFGLGVGAFALGSAGAVPARERLAAALAALGTVGVALTPLDHGLDGAHAAAAGASYLALAAMPAVGGRRGGRVAAVAIGSALLASTTAELPTGAFQRLGLTLGDAWIVWRALRRPPA